MDHPSGAADNLTLLLVLLAAAVISVPLARKLRLSAIVAYLAVGVLIGPFGLGLFRTPASVIAVAELGIVMLLFVIGLELELSRLLKMRSDIFGLGAAQLLVTAAAIGGLALLVMPIGWRGALVAGLAFALSSTAIALSVLEERGHLPRTYGQRAFAILLFQDMAVVPILALLPVLAVGAEQSGDIWQTLRSVGLVAVAVAAVVCGGRYLLNPAFALLARTGAREVMTAAALLVVLGTAQLMHLVGMSMALGAFLAGVMLAESNYRHELEADIEPFRGLLLALFFMGVGMGIDLAVVRANLLLILFAAALVTVLKVVVVGALFRATCADRTDALRAGSVLTPAGEFAFVLLPLGGALAMLSAPQVSLLTAIAAVTMLLSTPTASLIEAALARVRRPRPDGEPDGFEDARGSVLLIGFGRFGQIVSQCLLTDGIDVTCIDNDAPRIQQANDFGFKVYYGDGTRLDVLRAAGAGKVQLIAVCVNARETTSRIVGLLRAEFPDTPLFTRTYDRGHSLELLAQDVTFEMRETFESALSFGQAALEALSDDPVAAAATIEDVRARDRERLALQRTEGLYAGLDNLHRQPVPTPLRAPRRRGQVLNPVLNPEGDAAIAGEGSGRPQQ